jgi:hypothetical protein
MEEDVPMELRGAEAHRRAAPGRHLLYVFIGWGLYLTVFGGLLVPPLGPDLRAVSPALWSTIAITITALLTLYTAVAVPVSLYHLWLKLPTVSNKMAYGLWIGVASLLFLAMESGAIYLLLYMLFGMWVPVTTSG